MWLINAIAFLAFLFAQFMFFKLVYEVHRVIFEFFCIFPWVPCA